jgi:hypothetical protein
VEGNDETSKAKINEEDDAKGDQGAIKKFV